MKTEQQELGTEVATVGETLPAKATENGAQVNSLIELAIEKGVDVEVLERLVALQERVTERNARGAYFDALTSFQEECPEIPKSAKAKIKTRAGGSYGYTYAPIEAITRTIRPVLKKHGLSFSFTTEEGSRADVLNVVCILRHVDGHEERAAFPVPTGTDAAMSAAQKNGAALTYGRRQSLIAVLGLTTADADTDGAVQAEVQKITAHQAADLDALIDEVGADRDGFLQWLGIDALEDLESHRLANATAALESKRGKS